MQKFLYIVFSLMVTLIFTSFNSETKLMKWNVEKSKNGIIVYSFLPEGERIKQIKVHSTVKGTLSAAVSVLKDVKNYPLWIYNCENSEIITQKTHLEMEYYTQSKTPWPLQNRDLVVSNRIYQDKAKKVHSISMPLLNKIPEKDNLVRITDFYGEWIFTPLTDNEIAIDYYLKVDPAGTVPSWILNMVIDVGPYQTMENFVAMLQQTHHQKATFSFIKN